MGERNVGDLDLLGSEVVVLRPTTGDRWSIAAHWCLHGHAPSLRLGRGRCRLIRSEMRLGLALQLADGLGRVVVRLVVRWRRPRSRRRELRELAMMFEIARDAAQNRRIHRRGVIGNASMQRELVRVRHELKIGLLQQRRMRFQEPLFVIAQTGHGIDVRVNPLPRRRIERRFGKPGLRACRMLPLQMLGVLLRLQGER